MHIALKPLCLELGFSVSEIPRRFKVMELDLDSFRSVARFVSDFYALGDLCLSFLVNNAGAMLSASGLVEDAHVDRPIDKAFCSNHLGHFLLTSLLFPTLVRDGTRVVSLSSAIHLAFGAGCPVESANMCDPKTWDAPAAYSGAKIANIWFIRSLQRRFDAYYTQSSSLSSSPSLSSNTVRASAFALAPGTVWTPFHMPYYRNFMGGVLLWFPVLMAFPSWLAFKSSLEGCQTTLHLLFANHPDVQKVRPEIAQKITALIAQNPSAQPTPGQMHAECRVSAISPVAADDEKAEEMWAYSLRLTQHVLSPRNTPHYDLLLSQ